MQSLKIAVCYEPPPENASEDLLDIEDQVEFIIKALPDHNVVRLPYRDNLPGFLAGLKEVDLAWNLFELFQGREERQQLGAAIFEIAGVPYTGNIFDTLCLVSDKRTTKAVLASVGLPVPEIYRGGTPGGRWIVKPAKLHGSCGISDGSVFSSESLSEVLRADKDLFAEKYIDGDEYSASLIDLGEGLRTVAVAKMQFEGYPQDKPRILGFDAKWSQDSPDYQRTIRTFDLNSSVAAGIAAIADKAAEILNLSSFARIDFRMDGNIPQIIDVNPNPGLGADSGFMAACAQAGLAKPLEYILKAAFK